MLNNRQSGRRRGRGRGAQGGGQRENQSRIDNRARGNAPQLLEKYKNLAREAQLQGDRVMTEYYLQFADHYFRIVAESRARFEESRQQRRDEWSGEEGSDGEGMAEEQGADGDDPLAETELAQERPRRDNRRDFSRERGPRRQSEYRGNEAADNDSAADDSGSLPLDILPPALGVTADPIPDIDETPAPRRRTRARKVDKEEAAAE